MRESVIRRPSALAAVVVAAAVVAACSPGDDSGTSADPSSPTTTSASSPATTDRPPAASTAPSSTAPTTTPTSAPAPPDPSIGPVWESDFPDPFVLEIDGTYYAYGTESGLLHIQGLVGSSVVRWIDLHEALPELPPWAAPYSSWAPAVLPRDGRYVLYYTVLVEGTDRHCIGLAVADRPEGPFVDDSTEPFLCPMDVGGAIDPSPFVDADGSAHLLWKNDGITLRQESAIWSQPLAPDGLALTGTPARLVATDQPWEFPHVEAPSMARVGGRYWLAYSGNWWNQDAYGVGLARCESPRGPCEKPFDHAVLVTRPGAEGPGGLEFFRDAAGTLRVVYHAWLDTPGYPGSRALWIDGVDVSGPAPVLRPGG